MEIRHIKMISFRNHGKTNISFNPKLTVIWGENGSGKTSVLEAIHSLSIGKSFKKTQKKDLIKKGEDFFLIEGVFKNKNQITNKVLFNHEINGKQKIQIDNKTIKKRKNLIGLNNVVVFSPEEEKTIKGYPKDRRIYFNRVFSIASKKHLNLLLSYNIVLKQRNQILKNKEGYTNAKIINLLKPWDETLADLSQKTWSDRIKNFNEFKKLFLQTSIRFDKKIDLKISYKKKKETKNHILKEIQNKIKKDIILKTTSLGPHKDEFSFLFKNKDLKKQASQGENKLFLAVLKITELLFISRETNRAPIFLIDDLFANLDKKKCKKITNFINKIKINGKTPQTIITTTDIIDFEKQEFFKNKKNITKHKIKRGCNV